MKNTFWNIIFFALTGMIVTSCSGNNDDAEPTIGGEGSALTVNGKRLVKIKYGDTTINLVYNSNGQLYKVKQSNRSSEDSYWYEDRRIIWSPNDIIYKLSNGRVVECNYTVLLSDGKNAQTVDGKDTYEYDSNGNLIKITIPDFTYDGEDFFETYAFSWQNGNIDKAICSREEQVHEEHKITYTSYTNNIPFFFVYYIPSNVYLIWQGFFGKRCKNLPASDTYTFTWFNGELKTITYTYTYSFEDGLVTKITQERSSEGVPSTEIYELEWW